MSLLKLALLVMKCNKKQTIITCLFTLVCIISFVSYALLYGSAQTVIDEQQDNNNRIVNFHLNDQELQKMMNGDRSYESSIIDIDVLERIATSQYVSRVDFSLSNDVILDIKRFQPSEVSPISTMTSDGKRIYSDPFELTAMSNFTNPIGKELTSITYVFKLSEGNFPQSPTSCMISKQLADHNKLKVGDTITLTYPITWKDSYVPPIPLTISGIFLTVGGMEDAIYVSDSFFTIEGYEHLKEKFYYSSAVYELYDASDLQDFEKEARTLGLGDDMVANTYGELTVLELSGYHILFQSKLQSTLLPFCILTSITLFLWTLHCVKQRRKEMIFFKQAGYDTSYILCFYLLQPLFIIMVMFIFLLFFIKPLISPLGQQLFQEQLLQKEYHFDSFSFYDFTSNKNIIKTISFTWNQKIILDILGKTILLYAMMLCPYLISLKKIVKRQISTTSPLPILNSSKSYGILYENKQALDQFINNVPTYAKVNQYIQNHEQFEANASMITLSEQFVILPNYSALELISIYIRKPIKKTQVLVKEYGIEESILQAKASKLSKIECYLIIVIMILLASPEILLILDTSESEIIDEQLCSLLLHHVKQHSAYLYVFTRNRSLLTKFDECYFLNTKHQLLYLKA